MADIASGNVTYAFVRKEIDGGLGKRLVTSDISFGNGALTYPAGGIPLLKASLGCPSSLEELNLVDPGSANGYAYKYDATNEKLRIYEEDNTAGNAPMAELAGGSSTPAAATLRVAAKGY